MTAATSQRREGDAAPDFHLPGAGGETLSLAGLKGRIWFSISIPRTTRRVAPRRRWSSTRYATTSTRPARRLLVCRRIRSKATTSFASNTNWRFRWPRTRRRRLSSAYGVWVEKSMYGRKYMGVERSTFLVGADGRIAKIWRKVKVPGHAEAVLAAAKAL